MNTDQCEVPGESDDGHSDRRRLGAADTGPRRSAGSGMGRLIESWCRSAVRGTDLTMVPAL
jgi:hypothetical protein